MSYFSPFKIWGITLFGGAVTGLAYYSGEYGLFAWISLIPLLHIIASVNFVSNTFQVGYVFGLSYNLVAFYWIGLNSGTSISIALLSLIAAVCYLSIFWGFLTVLIFKIKRSSFRLLIFPFLVVSLEWIRSIGPLGFPWSNLALTQINFLPIIQIMDITGSYGISALVSIINVILYLCLIKINRNRLYLILLATLVCTLLWISGTKKINYYNKYSNTIEVAVIQPNIDPNTKWDIKNKRIISSQLDSLFEISLGLKVDLILFPETAYPTYLRFDNKVREHIQKKVNKTGIATIIGTVDKTESIDKDIKYYNSSFLFTKNHDIQIYNKVHLVPFAEYVPLSNKIPYLKGMNFGQGNFSKGERITNFNLNGLKFANLICYESSIPNLVTRFVKKGADFLTIQTNDGWLGNSIGPFQHYNISRIRAIENRIPIVRSGNTGISGMILPNGISKNEKGIGLRSVFQVSVPIINSGSIYSKFGNILIALHLIITLILFICFKKKS